MAILDDALTTTLSLTNQPPSAWSKENSPHPWHETPSSLSSKNTPHTLTVSTGYEIYKTSLLPAIESATSEVILATCFWASSSTLTALATSLKTLSSKSLSRNDGKKIRVYICFSSHSLLQKLLHTSNPKGKVYSPSQWAKLGLPPPTDLPGLELIVKSIFYRPFSVMHPKFLIIDRKLAYLPSCNVSWEDWLECCISISGSTVLNLLQFFEHFWMHGERLPPLETSEPQGLSNLVSPDYGTETVLLPHQHHNSLRNSIFILSTPAVPLTSLNVFLLHILTTARTSIFILSPNLTAPPVLSALLAAVERGVNVHIISNKRMMLLEQLVTAGTITEICVWKLARDYKKLLSRQRRNSRDLEQGRENVGALRIEYFKPLQKRPERSTYDQEANALPAGPQKSHIKCTIVDDRVVVLGSGNMDRASWFTSQELGIGFIGTEVVAKVWKDIDAWLEGRVEGYFPRW